MKALVLIGHGALNKASGASMIRHAALLKRTPNNPDGVADFATAGFLNFSQPTFKEAVQRCADKGATQIIVQPYFLIHGYYVKKVLKDLLNEAKANHPEINFEQLEPFGDHPALAKLAFKRLQEAETDLGPEANSATVLMAHGTPHPEANEPLYKIAERLSKLSERSVRLAFMECNEPTIPDAIKEFVGAGFKRVALVPYFLQRGGHVRGDLPDIFEASKLKYPQTNFLLAQHLDYDELLLDVIRDRLNPVVVS